MRERKVVPKRRLKEFQNTDAWEQRTIGEFGYFYYGKSAPKWSVTSDATTPCVRYGELYTKHKEKIDKIYSFTNIPKENLKFSTGKEVLVPRVGEDPLDFANCSWLSISGVAIGEMISVYNTKQNPLFTAYMFNALFKHEFAKRVEGGNVSNLYYAYLENIAVSYPSIEEQEKIASFFESLSTLITLHEHKLEKTKALKSAYLAEMFPAEGERVPKRRFAGFTGEWEIRDIGDLVTIATGKLDANEMEKDGEYDFYTSGIKKYKINNYAFSGPAITIAGNGANVGYMHLADGYFNAYQRTYVLNNFLAERLFLFYNIGIHLPKKINEEARMGNIPYIVMDMLTNLAISMPKTLNEQIKIGEFFKKLDESIANQQQKLDKLKAIKQAYLQEMFV